MNLIDPRLVEIYTEIAAIHAECCGPDADLDRLASTAGWDVAYLAQGVEICDVDAPHRHAALALVLYAQDVVTQIGQQYTRLLRHESVKPPMGLTDHSPIRTMVCLVDRMRKATLAPYVQAHADARQNETR